MPGGAELSEKLPDEIFQLVESFKKFIREQKAYRDQKFDVDVILEVGRDTEEFTLAFQRVAVDSDRNSQLVKQIKDDTTKLLRHSELAYSLLRSHFTNNPSIQQQQQPQLSNLLGGQQQSTLMTGNTSQNLDLGSQNNNNTTTIGQNDQTSFNLLGSSTRLGTNQFNSSILNQQQQSILHQQQPFYLSGNQSYLTRQLNHNQFANTSTSQYFAELADQFEAKMKAYGEQIKELKMSLDSITRTYNVDELFKWLKKQHETLGEIAAKIYMTHERIMEKKSELDKFNNANNNKTLGSIINNNNNTTTTNTTTTFT